MDVNLVMGGGDNSGKVAAKCADDDSSSCLKVVSGEITPKSLVSSRNVIQDKLVGSGGEGKNFRLGKLKGSGSKRVGNESDPCGKCRQRVVDEGLQCDLCDVWWHLVCSKTTPEGYRVFSNKVAKHLWFCSNKCRKEVKGRLSKVVELESSVLNLRKNLRSAEEELKEKNQELNQEVMSYKDRISSLERSNKNLSLELNEKGKLMEEILNDKDMERVDCMSLQEHSYAEVVKKDISYKKQVKNSGVEGKYN